MGELRDLFQAIQTSNGRTELIDVPGEQPGDESTQVMAVPIGTTVASIQKHLDEVRSAPRRRKGVATMTDLASFVAHANRFKSADSAIFAHRADGDDDPSTLTSVIDYHPAGAATKAAPLAAWGAHRGRYEFPMSKAWEAWTGVNGEELSQVQFADFIEAHMGDVFDPSTAGDGAKLFASSLGLKFADSVKLLGLARGLNVNVDRKVQNSINTATGEGSLRFSETHNDELGAPLAVPGAFVIAIEVFRSSGVLYQLPVRLRYRVKGQAVVWIVELYRPELVFDDAFNQAIDLVKKETALPVFMGSPE